MVEAGGCYNSGVVGSGAGGSSFISGYEGCDAIEETSTVDNIIHTGSSMHYSGVSFVESVMLDGASSMPSYYSTSTMTGNAGDGYARISYISDFSSDSSLKSLKVDKGTIVEEFSPELKEYTVKLNADEYTVNFILETNDPLATINEEEYINVKVPVGKSVHKIRVYAQDGSRTVYTINFEREASDINYIEGITVNDKYYKFIDGQYNYEIILPYDADDYIEISADYLTPSQKIEGLGVYLLQKNQYEVDIKVTSEDKGTSTTYHLKIVKENSNKIKTLEIAGMVLNPEFDPDVLEYSFSMISDIKNVNISATPYDPTSTVTITGAEDIPEGESQILITVSNPNIEEDNVYIINVESKSNLKYDYATMGGYEEFVAPMNGTYKIELWGAEGESDGVETGYGGYTAGEIELVRGEKLYIYVGASGLNGGYNGGGKYYEGHTLNSGGGATDVRLVPGEWYDTDSLLSRIMVAAGGGGHYGYTPATYSASAGGLSGYGGTAHPSVGYRGYGATQTSGGSGSNQAGGFGYGGWSSAYRDGHVGGGRRFWILRWWRKHLALTRWTEVHHLYQDTRVVTLSQKKEYTQDKVSIILINILQIHL